MLSGAALGGGSPIGQALVEILPKIGASFGKQVGDQIESSIGGRLQGIGGTLTKTLTPIAGAIGGALGVVAHGYHQGVDEIAVATGKSGEALKGLVNDARAVAGQVVQPFSTVADLIAKLNTRLGLTGKPLQDLTTQILTFSRATKTDASANTEFFINLLTKWGLQASDLPRVMDEVLKASQLTNTPVAQLSDNVAKFASTFKLLGMDMPTALAFMGDLHARGLDVDATMTALGRTTGILAKGLKDKVPDAFKAVSKSWDEARRDLAKGDASAALRALLETISSAPDKFTATQRAVAVFGPKLGTSIANAFYTGGKGIDDLSKKVADSAGATKKAGDETMHFGDHVREFWNGVAAKIAPVADKAAVGATIISALGPTFLGLGKAVEVVGPKLASMGETLVLAGRYAAESAGEAISSAASWVAASATKIGAWIAESAAAVANAAVVAASWVAAWIAQAAAAVVNAAVIAAAWLIAYGPIILIGAAIVALVVLIVTHWTQVKAFLVAVWNAIKSAAEAVWHAILAALTFVWNLIKTAVTSYFNIYKTVILAVWNAISAATRAVWGAIHAALSAVWGAIRAVALAVWGFIRAYIAAEWNLIRSIVTGAINAVLAVLSGAWNTLKSAAQAAWDFVVGIFEGAWNTISGIVGKITGALSKLAFWRHSPSLLEQHAQATVDGILGSFAHLQRRLPDLVADVGLNLSTPVGSLAPTAKLAVAGGDGGAAGSDWRELVAEMRAMRRDMKNLKIEADGKVLAGVVDKRKAYDNRGDA